MHPGFCSVCCDVFDQIDCVPCRISCGHVACQRCCDTLVESRQCCPFRCDMAILRPRDIRPMAMSLVTDSDSFNEGIVRSKVLAILSDIRAFQLQYNQNSLSVHSLRANVSVQKDSIQKYARILHKVIQKRKDVFQSLARARAEYEGEVSTQCQLREELTQLRGMVWIAFSSTIHAQIFGVAARNSHHTAQNTSQYATLCLDVNNS
ncbi:uncharacterized protein LACBIDRAFT_308570 [Laccaria bicolor S238N-H82]|uniref:Predicted protein n=1 Tax=Laccaria bicolor (strain S238N-H82 / ATCC MYA-4686) TaxID=486041 RepID=B0CWP3_LACBS|nr:uncharacterized protein LACBIDRAFT_308570 [Laccaria bicolor S238N-H82]EDR13544.1 predicted protein [Laccaria bicolor S238N-H82]|eukprot:XP_001876042.1 predicted protein [Laccaria bicolor S238N-H82]